MNNIKTGVINAQMAAQLMNAHLLAVSPFTHQ